MRASHAIFHPTVPFVEKFETPLQLGSVITIDGFVPDVAENIEVNFASGPHFDPDNRSPTALHFNACFAANQISRNTYTPTTSWGNEEHAGFMTLAKDHPFQLTFRIESNEFQISINGVHFCGYSHRLPFRDIDTLQIVGDVMLNKVLLHTVEAVGPQPVNHPELPFEYALHQWMGPGKAITVLGVPKSFPQNFVINLYNETTGDVMFHFNPRFTPKRQIVRNAKIGGKWGEEQHETPFMLMMPDARFSLKIICEPEFFTVLTNEKHFCYFQHQAPPNQVTSVRVEGDVDIESITFTSK